MSNWSPSDNWSADGPVEPAARPGKPGKDEPTRRVEFAPARSEKRKLLDELQASGGSLRPEDVLPRWPADPQSDADVASLLFTDYWQRQQRGETPDLAEYEERFPQHRTSLTALVHQHEVMRSLGANSGSGEGLRLPTVGEELFGFRLGDELGRGAFARVFLAAQASLAGRPVVLKVSAIDGDEPQTLAQMQHTHIVPIYSVHEDEPAGLRAVCMPYFGGASLSAVLKRLWAEGAGPPGHGRQFVEALAAVGFSLCDPGQPQPIEHGALPLLKGLSFLQTSAWITARLAEALEHAHGRGVLHRDIKPSNVLVSSEGQPMLLDFNLAQNRHSARARATLGGTVSYMAPEHLRALGARDPVLARQVDHRADIYSLGMVLFEMLTGHSPFDQSASYSPLPLMVEAMMVERSRTTPSLRKQRPDAPWALESILCKCLAPDPARRYQRAADLAEDLNRFLTDRPLKHAPELSVRERLQKWARRHPRLTSSASVAAAAALLLAVAGGALAATHQHLSHTQEQLAVASARERQRACAAGTERALCLVNTTSDVQDHLAMGLRECEETLGLYQVLERDDWQQHPDWRRLDEADRQRLAEDTRELLMLLAWARVRLAPGDATKLRDALRLLDRAEAVEGLEPSPALWHDRAFYLARLGDETAAESARERAEATPPASARDHYLLATTLVRSLADSSDRSAGAAEVFARSLGHLDEAVRLNPRHYWSHVQRGICRQELGLHGLAAGDFGVCIGLWPEFSWGHFNRGVSLDRLGRRAEAIADYSAALERDPEFLLAWLNRGLARLDLKQYDESLADFDQAARLGLDTAALHAGRAGALEGLGRHADADAACAIALERTGKDSDTRVNVLLQQGFSVASRLPERARQAFAEVLRLRPDQPRALYGQAMLLVEGQEIEEAIVCFSRALKADPHFVEARRFRAVLLARRKEFEAATQDINWCLDREPESGPTLYAAACVSARIADWSRNGESADQALRFLKQAFARGYGRDRAGNDPDLEPLRRNPEFPRLLSR